MFRFFFLITALLLIACDSSLPEVNDENCTKENIQKIKNKEKQQKLASQCIRRDTHKPGEFQKSEERKW